MALYITFFIGGFVTKVPGLCGIVSALLQYFFLVFFAWTAVESVWLYLKLVAVLGCQSFASRYMFKAGLPAWCKLIMLGICECYYYIHFCTYTCSGPTPDCSDKHSLWTPVLHQSLLVGCNHTVRIYNVTFNLMLPFSCRATEWPFWFGHIIPFMFVYVFNWVMFTIIMVSICKHTENMNSVMKEKMTAEKSKKIKKKLYIAMSLSVVLGLGWGLGLAATSSSVVGLTVTFQVIFSIFVGMQGVLIFVLHGVRNKDARELWKKTLTRSKHLFSSLKSTSVAYSLRETNSDAYTTLPRSIFPRSTKNVNFSKVLERSSAKESKVDLSEISRMPKQAKSTSEVETIVDLPEEKMILEQDRSTAEEVDLSAMKVLSKEE